MNELRLLFDKSADGDFAVRIVPSSGNASEPVPFKPFLDDDDFEDLRWYLEDFMDLPDAGSLVRAHRVEEKLRDWGRSFYNALFKDGDNRELLNQMQADAAPRLLTLATRDVDILRLPWELMSDSRGPLVRQDITIRRQLETAKTPIDFQTTLPLRILYVVSRPGDLGFIDPRLSSRSMLDALAPLGDDVHVDFCRPPTLPRLEEMLSEARRNKAPYHLVHFDGHGTFLPEIELGALCFEKPDGATVLSEAKTDYVRADRLGDILATYKIPLVILEACRTGTIGKLAVFRAVAPRLIEAGVGSVISMSHAVHVEAARILLERFYRELVTGCTVGQALEQGRAALIANPHRWIEYGPGGRIVELQDWYLPHLYQRSADLSLVPSNHPQFQRESRSSATDHQDDGRFRLASRDKEDIGSFPPSAIYGFQGRAQELYELERRLRSHRSVLLYAMGGMGKTALAGEAAQWWTRSGLFPDGACFLSFEQPASAERIIQVLGTYLDGNEFNSRPEDEQRRRARELFRDKNVLMVWDNFESALPAFQSGTGAALYSNENRSEILDLFRDWTGVHDARGRLLITCRPEETGLLGSRKHELGGLARPDSLWLLVRVLETAGVDLNDQRLGRDKLNLLLDTLADHPLSIELVGPHLKNLTPEEIIVDFGRLLAQFKRGAGAERNESLLASLEFSKRRLGEAAQAALPWLGLFSGGVFEDNLLAVSGLDPLQWDAVRADLEATALVRVERDSQFNKRPYLSFHPTLPYALVGLSSTSTEEGPEEEVRRRYISVYQAVMLMVEKALTGSYPQGGLEVLAREEANVRLAVRWAIEMEGFDVAAGLGYTFMIYLQMSGRLRERDAWVKWLSDEVGKGGFSRAFVERERDAAWVLFTQGHSEKAILQLENLLERLRVSTEFEIGFQLCSTQSMLGQILSHSGFNERAVPVLEESVAQWETLVNSAGAANANAERINLSSALANLANARMSIGCLDEALTTAERSIAGYRELDSELGIAGGLGLSAQILMEQGRYAQADTNYSDAIAAAIRAGDKQMEQGLLQHQGRLAQLRKQSERAVSLYQRSMKLAQEMNDDTGVMLTSNSLGQMEHEQGRSIEARTWFGHSIEVARRLGDIRGLASASQNIGIVCQHEGEIARWEGRESEAHQLLEEGMKFVEESLQLSRQLGSEPGTAYSLSQLAQIHLLLGELGKAERYAHEAREIRERLDLKEVSGVYNTLAEIARARDDGAQASDWERRRDAIREELARRT